MAFIFTTFSTIFSTALAVVIGGKIGEMREGQKAMIRAKKLYEDNEKLRAMVQARDTAIREQRDSFEAFIKANSDRFPPPT